MAATFMTEQATIDRLILSSNEDNRVAATFMTPESAWARSIGLAGRDKLQPLLAQ